MDKKANRYKIHLETVSTRNEEAGHHQMDLEIENHDEIFGIIAAVQSKNLFDKESDAKEFALGLKLFSEVMLRHRKHPLFEELMPEFGKFMKKLKAS